MRLEGEITRGTTNPSRLRRVDRWITQAERAVLISQPSPLVVDLGYGATPVTTLELYRRVREVAPSAEVTGLEIDPDRVAYARGRLAELRAAGHCLPGLSFAPGGFELPVARRPAIVRAFNVLRQYPEERAWTAWHRLRAGLAPGGVLVEGTCDELGRRAVWITLPALPGPDRRQPVHGPGQGQPLVTFSARLASLERPSDLAERLPKVLIHRNLPGEPVHRFLRDWDRAWDRCAPYSVFGPRQRWLAAISLLRQDWPVLCQPPHGGQRRWRLGEVTIPWKALAPLGRNLSVRSHETPFLYVDVILSAQGTMAGQFDHAKLDGANIRHHQRSCHVQFWLLHTGYCYFHPYRHSCTFGYCCHSEATGDPR